MINKSPAGIIKREDTRNIEILDIIANWYYTIYIIEVCSYIYIFETFFYHYPQNYIWIEIVQRSGIEYGLGKFMNFIFQTFVNIKKLYLCTHGILEIYFNEKFVIIFKFIYIVCNLPVII